MRPIGHVGGGLVLTAVGMWTLDEPYLLWFTAVTVAGSLLPDVDLYLPMVLHQGIVHTYSVMFLVSIAGGLVAAGVATAYASRPNAPTRKRSKSPKRVFVRTSGAMTLGTFGHVTLDVVAYRESFASTPVEPLWPFTDWVPRINVFPPNAPAWNYGFLLFGIALWLVVFGANRRNWM